MDIGRPGEHVFTFETAHRKILAPDAGHVDGMRRERDFGEVQGLQPFKMLENSVEVRLHDGIFLFGKPQPGQIGQMLEFFARYGHG